MQKNILVGNIDNVKHSLHAPIYSITVPLQDTSFPFLQERCTCMTTLQQFIVYMCFRERLSAAQWTKPYNLFDFSSAIMMPTVSSVQVFEC